MKPTFVLNIIITVIFAVVLYVLLPLVAADISNQFAAVIGVLLGGLVIPSIIGLFNSDTPSSEDASQEVLTLYVGNLPYRANEQAVQEHFEQQGKVISVRLMKDRRTGKRKGYGFVEMEAKGATKAIKNLNDSMFQERTLKVRLAKEKVEDE
ncbi:RNA-binding protein [Paraglaciecola aquimarina]|uniref:RNA-binding protein n=1 Tax=Paraglaciecola aquimarina TaxID=1235557 RepID=A0ABU3SUL5_9ALTE|nr:RNA-binding protein [Paraglaciecola aquimarina]MDU0353678.1 RNA-binding protein [Paraglaciecola aquimarina]